MTTPKPRLTPEREATVRRCLDLHTAKMPERHQIAAMLLAELDAVRAERDQLLREWEDGIADNDDCMEESMTGELRKPHRQLIAEAKERAIAAAEARATERERAAVIAHARACSASVEQLLKELGNVASESTREACRVQIEQLELFACEVERAEHVNASDDVPTSGLKGGG
jgi:hypothetical protein